MPAAGPSLTQSAQRLLARGPAHTLLVAKEVLGLTGNPGAASAAVFTLLGRDTRFHVDEEGTWSLSSKDVSVGSSLHRLHYAVVDVETTGGSPSRGHRLIEVAVVTLNGGSVEGEFRTLLNPGRRIPRMITRITGITDAMVADAPFFDEVAEELFGWIDGRVFVAHNVGFDWRWVTSEMVQSIGLIPQSPRLCTVRMARRLLPNLRRRNLDSLCSHFGIPIVGRHRAHGDALATARALLRLIDEAEAQGIRDFGALSVFIEAGRRSRAGVDVPQPDTSQLDLGYWGS